MTKNSLLKKLAISGVLSGSLISNAKASFTSQVIDPGRVVGSPSIMINQDNGAINLVWSRGDAIMFTNNYEGYIPEAFDTGHSNYSSPVIKRVPRSNGVAIIYNAFDSSTTSNATFVDMLTDFADNLPVKLPMGNAQENISLDFSPDGNTIYIASQRRTLAGDLNVVVMNSSSYRDDYHGGNYNDLKEIVMDGDQINPSIVKDLNGNINLAYLDQSNGNKTKYRSSLDNFVTEQDITSGESYDAQLKTDSNGDVWIAYKSTKDGGVGLESGNVYLADRDSGWQSTRITPQTIGMIDNRQIAFSVDDLNNKYLSWSTIDNNLGTISLWTADSKNNYLNSLLDTGTDSNLGYPSIDVFNSSPAIASNIHSLVLYTPSTESPEPTSICLLGIGSAALLKKKVERFKYYYYLDI